MADQTSGLVNLVFSRQTGFFKQKTAYEIGVRLVGSEMCIRDRINYDPSLVVLYHLAYV